MKKKQPKRPWTLHCTEEQFHTIINGMEFYHRMMCGQVDVIDTISEHRISRETEVAVKSELFPELARGESYGWNGGQKHEYYDKESARSYQIYREMRHQYALREGHDNVYSGETLRTDKADNFIVEYKTGK